MIFDFNKKTVYTIFLFGKKNSMKFGNTVCIEK